MVIRSFSAVIVLLTLMGCAPPAVLPEAQTLGLEPASVSAARGVSATTELFPNYEARSVVRAGDWTQSNRDQAPRIDFE